MPSFKRQHEMICRIYKEVSVQQLFIQCKNILKQFVVVFSRTWAAIVMTLPQVVVMKYFLNTSGMKLMYFIPKYQNCTFSIISFLILIIQLFRYIYYINKYSTAQNDILWMQELQNCKLVRRMRKRLSDLPPRATTKYPIHCRLVISVHALDAISVPVWPTNTISESSQWIEGLLSEWEERSNLKFSLHILSLLRSKLYALKVFD